MRSKVFFGYDVRKWLRFVFISFFCLNLKERLYLFLAITNEIKRAMTRVSTHKHTTPCEKNIPLGQLFVHCSRLLGCDDSQ